MLSATTVTCLCSGLVCANCGIGFMHAPCTNYWSEVGETVIHVPYFMALRRCGFCGGRDWVQALYRPR